MFAECKCIRRGRNGVVLVPDLTSSIVKKKSEVCLTVCKIPVRHPCLFVFNFSIAVWVSTGPMTAVFKVVRKYFGITL